MNRAWGAALALAAIAANATTTEATGLVHFSVTQVRQLEIGTPAVRAYLDLRDADGNRPESLEKDGLTATLGEWQAKIVNLTPAWTIQQELAYIFLVDISRSLSPELFRQMVAGIETWVAQLGPQDRAAIIAFGDSSRLVLDFTDDKTALIAALAQLGPTDDATLLHQALIDALDLSRRLDLGLPGRRVIVIFSDGKDEGSAYTAEDVLARLLSDPAPIYAIGYSRLRESRERTLYLDLLKRFSFNSGGTFFAAEQTRFDEAYAAIRQAIGDVWIADFICSDCRLDGNLHRLQVKAAVDGSVLSSGGSVRLLPVATGVAPETTSTTGESPAREVVPPAGTLASQQEYLPWLIAVAAVVIGLLLYLQARRGRKPIRRRVSGARAGDSDLPSGPIDPRSEPGPLDPPMPVPYPREGPARRSPSRRATEPPLERPARSTPSSRPKQVRLIVVRGSRQGRQYSLVVQDRAIVGKRSSCDCVLAEEPGIDAEQFELTNREGGLYIRNLSDRLPTLVTGLPIEGQARVGSDTLVGTGDTVLRIVFF